MAHDLASTPAAPQLPPAPPPRKRGWWNLRARPTRKTPDRPCLNCGDPTVGFFCPTCGQKKVDVRVSLRRMTAEALEDELFMHVSLPRTVGALLFKPGKLTAEFVQGHIARYIQPFRLYLVSSLLLFILLPWLTNMGQMEEGIARDMARTDSIAAVQAAAGTTDEEPVTVRGRDRQFPYFNVELADTTQVPPLLRAPARRLIESAHRLNRMPPDEAVRTMRTSFMEHAPTGIFLMMPLFAAILKVLYLRRNRFYVEHFVFALHVHAFTFLTFLLMLLLPWKAVNGVLSVWLMLYVFLAMKRVYGQGIVKTFLKYAVLGWAYTLVLTVGVLVTMALTAFTL
jgi:hypothetical protein